MKTKICTKCDKDLTLDMFSSYGVKRAGLLSDCKACERKYRRKYYEENKDKYKEASHKYYEENKDRIKQQRHGYYEKNKESFMFRAYRWNKEHKGESKEYHKTYYKENKSKIKEQSKANHGGDYYTNKWKTDINYRLSQLLRSRIRYALKGKAKSRTTMELLGCSIEDLKAWLEDWFKEQENNGMFWDNYGKGEGKWNVDHIIPCSKFELQYSEEQEICFHFTNLQPLWAHDNISKGNRFIGSVNVEEEKNGSF